jgi:hypothetical protein
VAPSLQLKFMLVTQHLKIESWATDLKRAHDVGACHAGSSCVRVLGERLGGALDADHPAMGALRCARA